MDPKSEELEKFQKESLVLFDYEKIFSEKYFEENFKKKEEEDEKSESGEGEEKKEDKEKENDEKKENKKDETEETEENEKNETSEKKDEESKAEEKNVEKEENENKDEDEMLEKNQNKDQIQFSLNWDERSKKKLQNFKLNEDEKRKLLLEVRFSYVSHSYLIQVTKEPVLRGFQDLILEAMSMKLSKFEISDAEYTINCKPRNIYAPPVQNIAPQGNSDFS